MYISLYETVVSIAIHVALLLASFAYAALLAKPDIYKAYHPHNTIWAVVGGEALVGIAFGLECVFAAAWIRSEPLVATGLFVTLHFVAVIPIYQWQKRQKGEEQERERAVEAREEERKHGHETAGR